MNEKEIINAIIFVVCVIIMAILIALSMLFGL